MKTSIVCFLLLSFSLCANAQVQSSCIPPGNLLSAYDKDVKSLALNRMYDIGSPDTISISIPQHQLDTIWSGLASVFNLQNQLGADSIFDRYCIHDRRALYNISIRVDIDKTVPWTQAWQNQQTITGYLALDTLMSNYGFQVTAFVSSSYNYFNFAIIQTNQFINYNAFAKELEKFNGIWDAVPEPLIGDGDFIKYAADTTQRFVFSMGWGDCPSGCTGRKNWLYEVEDCKVALLSETIFGWVANDRVPTNCMLSTKVTTPHEEKAKLFPNPASDYIVISNIKDDVTYHLFNSSGIKLQQGDITTDKKIDISSLNTGLYILKMVGAKGAVSTTKFLKE